MQNRKSWSSMKNSLLSLGLDSVRREAVDFFFSVF